MKLGKYLLGPNDVNQGVYTGDARLLAEAIPDESIDLIFTDPVYQNIDDYRWLAETAARVLKHNGNLLVWASIKSQYGIKPIVEQSLKYQWTFSATVHGSAKRLMHYHIFTKTTPLLWFVRSHTVPNRWIMDTRGAVTGRDKFSNIVQLHSWQKHPEFIAYWLNPFSLSNDIIVDFFCGGGVIPAVCRMSGRHYLAFEIDPATADIARRRIANTQPPLPGLVTSQLELGIHDEPA